MSRTRELTKREMQLLAYLERHDGEPFDAGRIASIVDMHQTQVNETLRRLRGMGYAAGDELTDAGRKMLWPHIIATTPTCEPVPLRSAA